MILTVELTKRYQKQSLEADHNLDQDTEAEEEDLVQDRKVDTSGESHKEHLLDYDGGIDEDIGQPCTKPDGHAGDITLLKDKANPRDEPIIIPNNPNCENNRCLLLKKELVVWMNRNTIMVRFIIRFVVDRMSRPVFHSIVC